MNLLSYLLYTADFVHSRIQIVSSKGEFLTQFGNDKLTYPWGIAVDKECIFVTDIKIKMFQFRKEVFNFINRCGTKGNREG